MIKKIMVVFFGAFAIVIVLSVLLLSGKMTLLPSPDRNTVYELRISDGKLQHALRHGGVQLFSWSDISLEDESGRKFLPKELRVARGNMKTGEFEIAGFPDGIRLFVRVTDKFVASAFFGLPEGKTIERVELRPETGACGAQFREAAIEGLDATRQLRPFIFIAPRADGGDTFLVYHHTESGKEARPKFIYAQEDLAPVKYDAQTVYDETVENGWLHVLYFSDSPVLLHEIYEAGIPSEPFPTLSETL